MIQEMARFLARLPRRLLWLAIAAYRLTLAPVLGANCRFAPSCSAYAQEAVMTHGALKGGGLALWRILRCNPWGGCGHDPVPPGAAGPERV